ncbi:ATP-dependent DNA helicase PIF1-like protein [Tanacetum coccineum]
MDNRLIREALAFDMHKIKLEHQQLHSQLNPEQRVVYEEVVESVYNKKGQFYFVYGPGGTRKTFLYKTVISRLRSKQKIVLAVASSGERLLAKLLTKFVIPLKLLENSTYGIKQNTHLAELMQEVKLVIWDEAPMTQKYAFEALDKTLRDILGYPTSENRNKIYGGLMVLLGDDFRQILPIVAETYPNFIERQRDDTYLRERAILTPRNDDADAINAYMFDKLKGMSPHALTLKKELPIMLLRNVNPSQGLCNGTRLIITELGEFVLKAKILTGSNMGDTGQSLNYVALYLPNPIFGHGQLYVALSGVTNLDGLKILMKEDGDKELKHCTRNIVYKEAFNCLN